MKEKTLYRWPGFRIIEREGKKVLQSTAGVEEDISTAHKNMKRRIKNTQKFEDAEKLKDYELFSLLNLMESLPSERPEYTTFQALNIVLDRMMNAYKNKISRFI